MRANVFTWEYETKVNVLKTDMKVGAPFDETSPPKSPPSQTFQAIWDTGSPNSAISNRIVQTYNLQPTGKIDIKGVGQATKSTYFVSLWLPSKGYIPKIPVVQLDLEKAGADVLIGMDIISQGDFAITSKESKTVLSFRIPSMECVDFTEPKSIKTANGKVLKKIPIEPEKALPKVGRNDPCPCGSGLKYKKCHGR